MYLPNHVLRLILWLTTISLCGMGLVMVTSTTTGKGSDGLEYGYLLRQVVAMSAGFGAALVLSRCGLGLLRRGWMVLAMVAASILMLLVARFAMRPVNGAWRWIDLGVVSIQPVEIAKLSLIGCLAWYLVRVQERVRLSWHGALIPGIGFCVMAGLVYQTKDLGSVMVMAVILMAMLFFARARWGYMALVGLCSMPLICYVAVFQTAYRRERILAFLDPMNPDNAAAYHLRQSFIAIGSGGMNGVGLGQGMSKNAYLPEHHTDFIFAVVAEELGFIGAVALAAGFLVFAWTGFAIAARTRDLHMRLLAVGVTVLIAVQAFWNMLVVTGALPTKGLTLPFVSYGGSSVFVCLVAVGILDAVIRACPVLEVASTGHGSTASRARIGAVTTRRYRRARTGGA
ncbi:MAG: FtsW/RodA/SpoVE family cell cycle protein [Planctomycetota bacterium]|jgi:cell division protein FtsW